MNPHCPSNENVPFSSAAPSSSSGSRDVQSQSGSWWEAATENPEAGAAWEHIQHQDWQQQVWEEEGHEPRNAKERRAAWWKAKKEQQQWKDAKKEPHQQQRQRHGSYSESSRSVPKPKPKPMPKGRPRGSAGRDPWWQDETKPPRDYVSPPQHDAEWCSSSESEWDQPPQVVIVDSPGVVIEELPPELEWYDTSNPALEDGAAAPEVPAAVEVEPELAVHKVPPAAPEALGPAVDEEQEGSEEEYPKEDDPSVHSAVDESSMPAHIKALSVAAGMKSDSEESE